jgi:hypothetical protein
VKLTLEATLDRVNHTVGVFIGSYCVLEVPAYLLRTDSDDDVIVRSIGDWLATLERIVGERNHRD